MLSSIFQQCFGLNHHCRVNRILINTGSLIYNSKRSSLCVAWTLWCRIASKLFPVNITLYIEHFPPHPPLFFPFSPPRVPSVPQIVSRPWDVRYPYVDHWNWEPCMRGNIFVFLRLALLSKYKSFQLYLFLWKLQSFLLACDGIPPSRCVHTPHFFLVKESFHCAHTPTLKSIVLQHQSWFHSSAVVNSECYSKYGWRSISVICWLQRGNRILLFREDCRSLETVPEPRPGCCVPGLSVMRTVWLLYGLTWLRHVSFSYV